MLKIIQSTAKQFREIYIDTLEILFSNFRSILFFSSIGIILLFLFGIVFDAASEAELFFNITPPRYLVVVSWIISIISLYTFGIAHLGIVKQIATKKKESIKSLLRFASEKIIKYFILLWKSFVYSATKELLLLCLIAIFIRLIYPHLITATILSILSLVTLGTACIRSVYVFFSVYFFVSDSMSPHESMVASIQMVKGNWWKIFLQGIVATIVTNITLMTLLIIVSRLIAYNFLLTSNWYQILVYYFSLFIVLNLSYLFTVIFGFKLTDSFKK